MVIRQLICNSIECDEPKDGVMLRYKCPLCGAELQNNITLDNVPETGTYDFNSKISYTLPSHVDAAIQQPCCFFEEIVELFLALHFDDNGVKVCVQKSDAEGALGIPEDWWQLP